MDTIQDMIAAQRGELAAMLGELAAGHWDAPTLCAGWRVGNTAAEALNDSGEGIPAVCGG